MEGQGPAHSDEGNVASAFVSAVVNFRVVEIVFEGFCSFS